MANALKRYPRRIHHKREARNAHIPQATFKGRVLHAQNHLMAYRRKHFFTWGDFDNRMGGDSGTDSRFRFRCHTGYGATHITVQGLMGLHDTTIGAPADPSVEIVVTAAGGAALPTLTAHYGQGDGAPTDGPPEWGPFKLRVPVSANTTYEVDIRTVDYGRILACCAYEEASPIIDTSVDFYVDQATTSVGFPIFDQQRQDHLEGLSKMWRKNGTHLYTYPGPATGTLSPGTTWTNLIDGTTAISAASAKVVLGRFDDTPALGRVSDTGEVFDVVLAVYAQATGGNTGEVRFQHSGGTHCSITGITTTLQWHTTTTTMTLVDSVTPDLQVRNSNGAHSINVHAVSLYTYLA